MHFNKQIDIAYLLDFFPYPENKDGATKIIANILNRLGDEYNITVICLEQPNAAFDLPKNVQMHFEEIQVSSGQRRKNKAAFFPAQSLSKDQLNVLVKKYDLKKFDVIHTALHSFLRLSEICDNVIHGINDSLSRTSLDGSTKGKIKSKYFKKVEKKIASLGSPLLVVSENDAQYYPGAKTHVLQNGVDSDIFQPINQDRKTEFVFHGVMDYQPNIDSAIYMSEFLKNSDFNLNLIGRLNRNNQAATKKIFTDLPNCTYHGEVEDLSKALGQYDCYLALMKSGAGLKNKVLEAMSCGMVVIVNDRAIEGLSNKEDLKKAVYLVNNAGELKEVLNDQDNWSQKRQMAREYVITHYSWDAYLEKLTSIYQNSIN